jgi:hypothetical protein
MQQRAHRRHGRRRRMMPSRSYVPHHQLPGNIHREQPDPRLELESSSPAHPPNLIDHRRIDPTCDDSIGDPITYCVDDVIKHLRGAGGLVDVSNPVATNRNGDSRREDV